MEYIKNKHRIEKKEFNQPITNPHHYHQPLSTHQEQQQQQQ